MPDITNPDVLVFTNEKIRILAEWLLAFRAELPAVISQWHGTVVPAMAGDTGTDMIFDGSEADGRTQLSKNDISALMTQVETLNTQLQQAGIIDVLTKPSVNGRALLSS